MYDDKYYLERCLKLIEDKVNIGESQYWKGHHFEMISDIILENTGVNLSVATLKRLWGKVRYESSPNITTLNALASFTGYENWLTFKKSQSLPDSNIEVSSPLINAIPAQGNKQQQVFFIRKRNALLFIFGFLLLLLTFVALSYKAAVSKKINPDKFSFGSTKVVTAGVPNSVIFNYNAAAASEDDTVEIQQSWDTNLRQRVSVKENNTSSIYYYPGFYKAKLVVNNQVVKEHDLSIHTTGWLPLVERGTNIPVYFRENDALRNGAFGLFSEMILARNIPLQPDVPTTSYFNVKDFGEAKTDDFVFEAILKNDYSEGAAACQNTTVLLLCEENFISIPLSAKGCVANLNLYFLGNSLSGKKNNLTAFGCDFKNWIRVKCKVKDKKGFIYLDEKLVYETEIAAPISKISGMIFQFKGTGSLKEVHLSKSDGKVFMNEQFIPHDSGQSR